MEAFLLIGVLAGLIGLVLGIALFARVWSVLGMHRQAMHALHQELAQRRLERHMSPPPGPVPPQADPRTDPRR